MSLVKYGGSSGNEGVEEKVRSKERRGDVCEFAGKKIPRCEHSTRSVYQSFEYSSIFISLNPCTLRKEEKGI